MKKIKFALFSIVSILCFCSFVFKRQIIKGNRDLIVETRDLAYFNAVRSEGSIDVVFDNRKGSEIKILGESNLIPYVITTIENEKLTIKFKEGFSYVSTKGGLEVYVPAEEIVKIEQLGSGDIKSKDDLMKKSFKVKMDCSGNCNLKGVFESIKVKSTGSGNLRLTGHLTQCNVKKIGSGDVFLKGEGDDLRVDMSGSGDLYAKSFSAKKANVIHNGSGNGNLSIFDDLLLDISGSGDFNINGTASNVNITKSGSGSVNANNLKADSLTYNGSGSGDAHLWVTTHVNINNQDSGDISIKGNPASRTVKNEGSGSVR